MKSTPLTQGISLLILAIYAVYGLIALPFAGLLLSLAVGMMAFGAVESFEMSVAATIVVGVFYSLIQRSGMLRQAEKTPQLVKVKEGFNTSDGAAKIADRVHRIKVASTSGPKGVYASPFVEGFADATPTASMAATKTNGGDKAVATDATTDGSSKPAAASGSGDAGSGIKPPAPPAVTAAVKSAMTQASGFKGAPDDGLFKLGVIPEEKKGGHHIDQGTTVLNALKALKPDQIASMTKDTQSLIETQKSLMGMLSSMKPMLNDGKQMMETFQQMFGSSGGGMAALKL